MKKCLMCDKDFLPKRDWQKFCSVNCRTKHWNQLPLTINCPHCHKEIDLKELKEKK